jgi:hypothetical protein
MKNIMRANKQSVAIALKQEAIRLIKEGRDPKRVKSDLNRELERLGYGKV